MVRVKEVYVQRLCTFLTGTEDSLIFDTRGTRTFLSVIGYGGLGWGAIPSTALAGSRLPHSTGTAGRPPLRSLLLSSAFLGPPAWDLRGQAPIVTAHSVRCAHQKHTSTSLPQLYGHPPYVGRHPPAVFGGWGLFLFCNEIAPSVRDVTISLEQ